MRYILILFTLFACSRSVNAQLWAKQIKVDSTAANPRPLDSLYIMGNDTTTGSATYGLGKWYNADSLISGLGIDHDFYGLGTGLPPRTNEDSIETADTMYVLFKGLSGGIGTMIEVLKNGVINFDKTGLYNTEDHLLTINPFQSGVGAPRFGISQGVFDNTFGSRKNNVYSFGINPGGLDSGTSLYINFEGHYRPTSGPAYHELHLVLKDSSGVTHRPWTWFLDKATPDNWTVANYVQQFHIRDPNQTGSDGTYFNVQRLDDNSSDIRLMSSGASTGGGSDGIVMRTDNSGNNFQIFRLGSMPSSAEMYVSDFNVFNINKARIINDFGTTNGSNGQATSIIGREASYGGVVDVDSGWGWDLVAGALVIDSSQVATQYDLTTISGGTTDLTIGGAGPTYTVESSTGTDVTVAGAGIITLSESPANTLVITGTEVDGSITNEIQDITLTGTNPYVLDLGSDATDVTFAGAGIVTLSEGVANTLTITATEVDGSTSNELNVIEEGNVSVQTGNTNIDFQTLFDIAADGAGEVNVSLDLSEATTVTSAESDDYLIMHDAGSAVHQKILYSDLHDEIISFYDGTVLQGTGNAIDVGEGLDINMVTTEANINLDASEFQIDGAAEGTEYVLLHDADTTAGHQIQRRLVSSFGGADGNGIYSGDGTTPADVDVTITDNIDFGAGTLFINDAADRVGISTQSPAADFHIVGAQGSMIIEPDAAGGTAAITIEGKADGAGANAVQSTINMNFTDTDHSTATEQSAVQLMMRKESDLTQWTTFQIMMPENTDADVFVGEKNLDFSGNTTESHIAMNGGIAFTQNFEFSTASDLSLDRSYYNIIATGATGAVGDEILLPNVASESDNWDSALTSSDVQVGQTYVITNMRTSNNLVIRTNTGDYLNPTAGAPTNATLTLARFDSVILKCVHLDGTTGYWFTYD